MWNRIYILAGSEREARQWAVANRVQMNVEGYYLGHLAVLEGVSPILYVSVGRYYDRNDILEIDQYLHNQKATRIILADDQWEDNDFPPMFNRQVNEVTIPHKSGPEVLNDQDEIERLFTGDDEFIKDEPTTTLEREESASVKKKVVTFGDWLNNATDEDKLETAMAVATNSAPGEMKDGILKSMIELYKESLK